MKSILLAGVAVLALAGPARAQIPVTDATQAAQGREELASLATQVEQSHYDEARVGKRMSVNQ